ncbi:DUF4136 domain-containing protein [Telmatospirillum siberiense]|uniref:DUF4136 domain-containing protein n=1 Tax=Telmatospirillum siberiense TaxID=382514 RepID=A0A2N3Q0L6_9PROT|nr:DUF4136 domain-containing protein [Telmatospirillum siberiense]PKU26200.1 hypothetical protein CWS72_03505 [Telmatospirillum siberiense]
MKRLLVSCVLMIFLGACQPSLRADVTRFYSLPPVAFGQSFAIAPDPAQASDLEFQHNSTLLSGALQAKGFYSATAYAEADLIAVLHYGNVGSHTEIYTEPGGPGWGRPGWGWRPYPPEVASYTYYSQFVDVALFDGPAWRSGERRMLYQGRALTESGARDLNVSMPYLLRALFLDFPGLNGQTVRVVVPLDDRP